jgi:hypothetical protein
LDRYWVITGSEELHAGNRIVDADEWAFAGSYW